MASSRNKAGGSNLFFVRARTSGIRGAVKKEVLPRQCKYLPSFPSQLGGSGTLQALSETNISQVRNTYDCFFDSDNTAR